MGARHLERVARHSRSIGIDRHRSPRGPNWSSFAVPPAETRSLPWAPVQSRCVRSGWPIHSGAEFAMRR